jgi:hypothetical protein
MIAWPRWPLLFSTICRFVRWVWNLGEWLVGWGVDTLLSPEASAPVGVGFSGLLGLVCCRVRWVGSGGRVVCELDSGREHLCVDIGHCPCGFPEVLGGSLVGGVVDANF